MSLFDFLKPYVMEKAPEDWSKHKHVFLPVSEEDVNQAEKRLGKPFPPELREFYLEIGSGFVRCDASRNINRFMGPETVADFYLGEGLYAGNVNRRHFGENDLVFFEISEVSFLSIDLEDDPVFGGMIYLHGTLVASDIVDLFDELDQNPHFYEMDEDEDDYDDEDEDEDE